MGHSRHLTSSKHYHGLTHLQAGCIISTFDHRRTKIGWYGAPTPTDGSTLPVMREAVQPLPLQGLAGGLVVWKLLRATSLKINQKINGLV